MFSEQGTALVVLTKGAALRQLIGWGDLEEVGRQGERMQLSPGSSGAEQDFCSVAVDRGSL